MATRNASQRPQIRITTDKKPPPKRKVAELHSATDTRAKTAKTPQSDSVRATSTKKLPPKRKTADKRTQAQSHAKAAKAFKDFSLSKFAGTKRPANHVPPGTDVQETHRRVISNQLERLSKRGIAGRSMSFALPESMIKRSLPSFDQEKKEANLSEILKVITKQLRGREFVASGNPVLRRLAVRSQIDEILSAITKRRRK